MRKVLFFSVVFIFCVIWAATLVPSFAWGQSLPHEYEGADLEQEGINIVTFQEMRDGWCHIELRPMTEDEIHTGAFEEYLDGNSWILGPKSLFPEQPDYFQTHNACDHYDDMRAPAVQIGLMESVKDNLVLAF